VNAGEIALGSVLGQTWSRVYAFARLNGMTEDQSRYLAATACCYTVIYAVARVLRRLT